MAVSANMQGVRRDTIAAGFYFLVNARTMENAGTDGARDRDKGSYMFNRLIALPSGEWVDPEIITGIRLEVRKIKRRSQVRVLLDTKRRDGLFIVPFGKIAVAQCWMANIGAACSTGEYLNDDDDDQSFEFLMRSNSIVGIPAPSRCPAPTNSISSSPAAW
jgi:hypothetical protein